MGKNVSTAPVSFRMTHDQIAALKKIAEERDTNINQMVGAMVVARVQEIREAEDW